MAEFSFTKVDGSWCVRVWEAPTWTDSLEGVTVKVATKGGAEKKAKLGKQLTVDRRLHVYAIADEKEEQLELQPKTPLPDADEVPAGFYAYPKRVDDVEIWQFVKIWRKDEKVAAYAAKGIEQGDSVNRREALEAIVAFGPGQAAQEFGWRTGYCSRCRDELKKNLSRKLGIGPVCMKKLFTNETRLGMMRDARKELRLAGLDPEAKYDSLEAA